MKNILKLALFLLLIFPVSLIAQNEEAKGGRKLFNDKCFACHRFDKKIVGPALGGVNLKHNKEWLRSWIKNSNALIKSGDYFANSIFEEYNKIPCYPNLDEKNIDSVLAYISDFPIERLVLDVSVEAKEKGKKIFNSQCAACHRLEKKLIGSPLKGITDKRERLWLHAYIKDSERLIESKDSLAMQIFDRGFNIPMPSYPDLSEEEIDDLLAYLKEED